MRANLLGKQLSISKMLSSEKVLKCIRWTLVIGLTISAVLFTRETWVQYTKKSKSFKLYEEIRTELPTTVLCFNPFLKASVLEEYNLDFFDLGKTKDLNNLAATIKYQKILKNKTENAVSASKTTRTLKILT